MAPKHVRGEDATRDTVTAVSDADASPEMRQVVAHCRLLGALFGDDTTIEFEMDVDGSVTRVWDT